MMRWFLTKNSRLMMRIRKKRSRQSIHSRTHLGSMLIDSKFSVPVVMVRVRDRVRRYPWIRDRGLVIPWHECLTSILDWRYVWISWSRIHWTASIAVWTPGWLIDIPHVHHVHGSITRRKNRSRRRESLLQLLLLFPVLRPSILEPDLIEVIGLLEQKLKESNGI